MALNFPASPAPGQVFTAEGATFIWNGTVWLAQSPAVIPWATPEEALAGVIADKAMSPALVRAVSGDVILDRFTLAGTNYSLFVPPEFDGIELEHEGLIPVTDGAVGVIRVGTGPKGTPAWVSSASYNQSLLFHNTGAPSGISNVGTGFQATADTRIASGGVASGKFGLRSLNRSSTVYCEGRYRGASLGASGAFQQAMVDAFMFLGTGPYTHVGLFALSGAGFSAGRITVRGKR